MLYIYIIMKLRINWDAIGITSSFTCAIHCAILPLLISSFPVFGINIIENVRFEIFMILLAFLIGCFSLYNGYVKHHRSVLPLIIFSAGILLLCAKQAWHYQQLWFLIPAVICIITAHFLNYSLCKKTSLTHTAKM